ncbi:unnamed protein product [Coregonus sp. 'balchen']|nr:unnamed protein product [Coregonus sp. 'balchen']
MAAQEPSPPSSLEGNKPGFPKKILANNLEEKHFSGQQKCSACIKEDLFEDPTSILKEGGVNHEGKCDFMIILCPSCKELMRTNELERHNERECPERTLNCKYCKEPFHFKNIKPQSLELAGHKIHELHRALRELELKLGQLTLGGGAPVQGVCTPTLPTLALPALATSFTPLPSTVGAALELQLHSEKTKVAELSRRCQELELKVGTFENIVCVLNREMERSSTTIEAYNRQHRLDQDKVEILNNKMEGNMREMSAATFDGIFVWKISDFTKKRQDAVAGRAPAMFSPAFFTSKYGYKMCLRIYLNGDGTGRGSHLSLFFVVMRGHSDALLKWPFNQKVTLMLLDQNNREHIIDAFRPDISSSSFQRPVSDMNIASGCPLFCPLPKLDTKNSYIRDDTIFIKAIVDLTGL